MTDYIIDHQVAHFDAILDEARRQLRFACADHKAKHTGHSLIHCPNVEQAHWLAQTARLFRSEIVRTSGYRRPVAA